MTAVPQFDDLSDVYEAMIDWPSRLAHEEPFYRRLFAGIEARRVLDAACGTGRHAAMFHGWGLRVEGADLSPAMIARAEAEFGRRADLQWVVRGFSDPIPPGEPFDAVVCVGNSLALAPDMDAVKEALDRMLGALRPGGLLVVQVLNLWRLADGPCQWQKCRAARLGQREVLVMKGVHRSASVGYVDLLVADLAELGQMQARSVPFLGFEAEVLATWTLRAGAGDVRLWGGYKDQPYQREASVDLVMVARR